MVPGQSKIPRYVFIMQVTSLGFMWVFVGAITWWIFRLITVALELHDAPDASVGISIVVIPVFLILASVLTYVFVGLQRNRNANETSSQTEGE